MTTLKTDNFEIKLTGLPKIEKGMTMTCGGFGLASLNEAVDGTWNVKRVWRGKRNMTVQLIRPKL